MAKPSISYHTYEAYEISIRHRLIPLLGHLRLQDLRPKHIQDAYAQLSQTLKPKTVRQTHVPLNQALNLAVEWGLIPSNPAARVHLPRLNQHEKTILTPEEVSHLLKSTRKSRLFPLWFLLVTTGARKGEALGLKWSDLDQGSGNLSIRRQIVRKTGQGLALEEPKTDASRRTIPLGPALLTALCEHRTTQLEERVASEWWDDAPEYQGLIFTTPNGRPLDPATTWAEFQDTRNVVDGGGRRQETGSGTDYRL